MNQEIDLGEMFRCRTPRLDFTSERNRQPKFRIQSNEIVTILKVCILITLGSYVWRVFYDYCKLAFWLFGGKLTSNIVSFFFLFFSGSCNFLEFLYEYQEIALTYYHNKF